jgi:shikimate 5-dehydrogenase
VGREQMLFVGVSTGNSSVFALFPGWMKALDADLELVGVDLPVGAEPAEYREITSLLASDQTLRGALITTHKVGIFDSCRDAFDHITGAASTLEEVGVVFKMAEGGLCADANDYYSTERVCRALLTSRNWTCGGKEAVILGAGGAGTALAYTLASISEFGCQKVSVRDTDAVRVAALERKVRSWPRQVPVIVDLASGLSDEVVERCSPGSLVVNATGRGKDRPGSPISGNAVFPDRSIVWEFNYRFVEQSEPNFVEVALDQQADRGLIVEDGWTYFLWGWSVAISRVLGWDDFNSVFQTVSKSSPRRVSKL